MCMYLCAYVCVCVYYVCVFLGPVEPVERLVSSATTTTGHLRYLSSDKQDWSNYKSGSNREYHVSNSQLISTLAQHMIDKKYFMQPHPTLDTSTIH